MLNFDNDYSEGAHPDILLRLQEVNLVKQAGYGCDTECAKAIEIIKQACHLNAADSDVLFLVGGTQTNMTVLDALLHKTQGVIAASSGHISVHEAGAIESSGHKVLTLEGTQGKLEAAAVRQYLQSFYTDGNRDHMVQPGAVYISQPTEYGTLYTLDELHLLQAVCQEYQLYLYVDGARLAYALASPFNNVTMENLAAAVDAFYIGGTKCGALFGEAVVFPQGAPRFFFTQVKQHGALLAKGFVLGSQFLSLFIDGLYWRIGESAVKLALELSAELERKGYRLYVPTQTNQIFLVLNHGKAQQISREVQLSFWEHLADNKEVWRIALSWATTRAQVDALLKVL